MNDSISLLELLELLRPKIQKELQQTDLQNRADLEQEIILKILEDLTLKDFQEFPSFFELLEKERTKT